MTPSTHWFESDPLWFKHAVFYEVHLRGFSDADADGAGDFRGLTERLDYLEWLGVDCVWLLPMYASPLRDGGYDISDFYSVHPDYGTIEDVRSFVEAAHQRGMRVIADMVINHTSSDHPWFQESRSSADSPKRDWYMWSDTDERYADARVIFVDTESSNWTWDPVAGAYYWHRFFEHQPDLNYDNPEVQEAMLDVIRFWLDLGLDGLRLDAVPYLFEREGTNCENLPETHAFLQARAQRGRGRLPGPRAARRGEPVARRRRRVLRRGRRVPHGLSFPGHAAHVHGAATRGRHARIRDPRQHARRSRTTASGACSCATTTSSTLEMVTDEERDYMYAEYAKDPRGKLNLGIRRRLAPLLDNGRDEMELMTAILFSLPGSPILYYGDEIGMGDNVYLGDRDWVRTPMQWTGDRNGGFSAADFAQLYLPPLMDPVYGFQAVNVEAQLRTPTSLLRWMQRIIALRKEHPVFGMGSYEPLQSSNPRIFAHIRRYEDDVALCVHNFARSAQAVELDLSQYEGRHPVEMFGRSRFPRIGELSYLLTFGPRGFFWFLLEHEESDGERGGVS